jgi:hypothetical protein
MKQINRKLCQLSALAVVAMATSMERIQAQTTLTGTYTQTFANGANTTPFANSGSVAGWFYWYGFYGNTGITNDVNVNVANNPANGSAEIDLPFTSSGNQQTIVGSFNDGGQYDFTETANGLNYTNISFDILVKPGTPPDSSGGFGQLNVGFYNTGTFGGVEIPGAASNGWVSLSVPVSKTVSGIGSVAAFLFNYNSYGGYPKQPITFWLDNVSLNYSGTPPPPPVVSFEQVHPGLNIWDSTGGTYDRQSIISTAATGNSWVGASGPVTYSFKITSYPTSQPSVAAQLFLIAGNPAIPTYETAPDYNESNVVIFAVQGGTSNAVGSIEYKVGEPNGNAMIYGGAPYTNAPGSGSTNFGSGNLGSVTNSGSALGTWSVTFAQNTNITITTPDGTSSSFTITASDAAAFADGNGFNVLLSSQPNASGAIGSRVVYSSISEQGNAAPFTDNFLTDSTLNTNLWGLLAAGASTIFVVPTTTAYIFDWTVPDVGFSPIVGTNLTNPNSFVALGLTPLGQNGSIKSTLIPKSSLPHANQAYYKLVQYTYSQLQVLLPGETNAPGTALGYVGSPAPISVAAQGSTPTTITVNTVDANFNIVNVSDTIKLTTSDNSAYLPAANVTTVNGTAVFSGANGILFQSAGSQTVTASDLSTANIPNGTSAAVTVGP